MFYIEHLRTEMIDKSCELPIRWFPLISLKDIANIPSCCSYQHTNHFISLYTRQNIIAVAYRINREW